MAVEGNELRAVTRFAAERCETVVEYGAATELATARTGRTETDGGTVASVGASGNIGPDLFLRSPQPAPGRLAGSREEGLEARLIMIAPTRIKPKPP